MCGCEWLKGRGANERGDNINSRQTSFAVGAWGAESQKGVKEEEKAERWVEKSAVVKGAGRERLV